MSRTRQSKDAKETQSKDFNKQGLYSDALRQRKKYTGFSIDDEAAKLLDDGLQITKQKNGDWLVEFFIADTPLYYQSIGSKPKAKLSGRPDSDIARHLWVEDFGLKETSSGKEKPAVRISMVFNQAAELKSTKIDRVLFENLNPISKKIANDYRKKHSNQWKEWDNLAFKIQKKYFNLSEDENCQKDLVFTFATFVNGLLANYAAKNNVPLLYQKSPIEVDGKVFDTINKAKKYAIENEIISTNEEFTPKKHYFTLKSITTTEPSGLASLKLKHYAKFTSPMRRISDAINLQNIIHHIEGKPLLFSREELDAISKTLNQFQSKELARKKSAKKTYAR